LLETHKFSLLLPPSSYTGLIKRAIDVYRGNHFAAYRPLVRQITLEIAAALALEKREDVAGGGMLTASPPPPPPPSALPAAKQDR
jgi:hypothetical protein